MKSIQWTLNYYFSSCPSWSYFFPYHYAPLVSDIKNLKKQCIGFLTGKPFLPLQHLVAVLPPKSSYLIPDCLGSLLTDPKSPIIDFYPSSYETDLNGKTNDWEALVLIPFIEESRLINGKNII